MTTIHEYTK